MDEVIRLFNFSGTRNRLSYLIVYLLLTGSIFLMFGTNLKDSLPWWLIIAYLLLIVPWIGLSTANQRLRAIGWPPFWLGCLFAGPLQIIFVAVLCIKKSKEI